MMKSFSVDGSATTRVFFLFVFMVLDRQQASGLQKPETVLEGFPWRGKCSATRTTMNSIVAR